MNYSGTVSFEFTIERDIGNDQYRQITLFIEGEYFFSKGSGPFSLMENAFQDESETEIRSVIGPDGKDWEDKLSDEEREEVLSIIQDEVYANDFDPDTDYDSRFDCGDF